MYEAGTAGELRAAHVIPGGSVAHTVLEKRLGTRCPLAPLPYGCGTYPFTTADPLTGMPILVYFNALDGDTKGSVNLIACSNVGCSEGSKKLVVGAGAAGFGRDASVTALSTSDSFGGETVASYVSFLQYSPDEDKMKAKLALLVRANGTKSWT